MQLTKTVFPEYLPPKNLSLLEIAVLLDNKLDYSDLSYQFFDFLLKGILSFDGKIITLVAGHEKMTVLSKFELDLLNILFEDMQLNKINLADINSVSKNKIYAIRFLVYSNLTEKGFYIESPMEQREKHFEKVRELIMLCSIYMHLSILYIYAEITNLFIKKFYSGSLFIWTFGFALFIFVPVVWLGIAYMMAISAEKFSKKTADGANVCARALGFKEFIVTAEKSRIEYLIRTEPDTYYQVLSFAYLFGVIRKWVPENKNTQQLLYYQQFEDLNIFGRGFEDSFTRANSIKWILYNLWAYFLPVLLFRAFTKRR